MGFNKKVVCIICLLMMFITFLVIDVITNRHGEKTIIEVISPIELVFDDGNFKLGGVDTFDSAYTDKNAMLAKSLNITEDEAFIFGNFGKYWAKNLLGGRKVKVGENDLIYYRFGYLSRYENSSFGLRNGQPTNKAAFERQLNSIRKGKFILLDLDNDKVYSISKENAAKVRNFVVVRRSHVKTTPKSEPKAKEQEKLLYQPIFRKANIKIIVSDLTTKIVPDRNCSSDICKELVSEINGAQKTIDMAIYGYSSTPAIEQALKKAISRGVKVRIVHDTDADGGNIYPDTFGFIGAFSDVVSDKNSKEVRDTMHNKFYIFDGKIVITGSANLSHTDMSGYNSNSIIVINSPEVAKFYTDEFDQMYAGKFHNDKTSTPDKVYGNIKVFFSPQDKGIANGILPLIQNAASYIYVPSFVITEKRITNELIKAKQRGVDVRIIADALNSSTRHSKSKEMRAAGIQVKAENYAGKMHSKSMIIDDKYVVIGSMNFSNSGENRNDENFVILEDSDAAGFYKNVFLYQWQRIPDKWLKYTPRAEGKDSIGSCSDGIDNNYDGKTDAEDEACRVKG